MNVFKKTITLTLAACVCFFSLTPVTASALPAAADVIETAESINSAYYTTESYAELAAALTAAKAANAGDTEIRALSHAINGLIQNDTALSIKTETDTEHTVSCDYAGFGANVSGSEDNTFANWSTMAIRSQASPAYDKAAYVKFTIPSLHDEIKSAKLTLTLSSVDTNIEAEVGAATPYRLGIYEVTDTTVISDNNNVIGRNLDKFGIYNSDALSVSSFANTESGTKIEFDITNHIKSITSPTVAFSIHGMVQDTSIPINKDVSFHKSGENAPMITITTTAKNFGFSDKTDAPEKITASLFTSAAPSTTASTTSLNFATWVDPSATRPKYLHSSKAILYGQDIITVRGKNGQNRYGIFAFDLTKYGSSYVAETASIKLYLKPLSAAYKTNEVTSNFYIREHPINDNTIDNITDLKNVIYSNVGGANFRNYEAAHETAISIPYTSEEGYITVNIDVKYINDCIKQGKKRAAFVITGHTGTGNVSTSSNADVNFSAQDNPPQLVLTSAYPESPAYGKTRDDSGDGVKIISKGSGRELSAMDGSTVGAIIPYSAIKGENDSVSLFLAGYSEDGQLIEMKPVTVDPAEMDSEYLEVYFNSKLDGQIKKIKAFVWSDNLLKPITGTKEI